MDKDRYEILLSGAVESEIDMLGRDFNHSQILDYYEFELNQVREFATNESEKLTELKKKQINDFSRDEHEKTMEFASRMIEYFEEEIEFWEFYIPIYKLTMEPKSSQPTKKFKL